MQGMQLVRLELSSPQKCSHGISSLMPDVLAVALNYVQVLDGYHSISTNVTNQSTLHALN